MRRLIIWQSARTFWRFSQCGCHADFPKLHSDVRLFERSSPPRRQQSVETNRARSPAKSPQKRCRNEIRTGSTNSQLFASSLAGGLCLLPAARRVSVGAARQAHPIQSPGQKSGLSQTRQPVKFPSIEWPTVIPSPPAPFGQAEMEHFFQDPPALANQYDDDHVLRRYLRGSPARHAGRDRAGSASLRAAGRDRRAGDGRGRPCATSPSWCNSTLGAGGSTDRDRRGWHEFERVSAEEGLIAIGYERKYRSPVAASINSPSCTCSILRRRPIPVRWP